MLGLMSWFFLFFLLFWCLRRPFSLCFVFLFCFLFCFAFLLGSAGVVVVVAGGCVEVVSRAVVVVFSDCILPAVAERTQQFAAGLMILKVRTLRASEGLPWSGICVCGCVSVYRATISRCGIGDVDS